MSEPSSSTGADADGRAAFARAFTDLLEWAQAHGTSRVDPLVGRLREHLGPGATDVAVVSREWPAFERVNLQLAVDAWRAGPGRGVEVVGYTLPPHFGSVELGQLVHGAHLPPLRTTAPAVEDLPSGPTSTTAVWRAAILLVDDERGRYLVHLRGPDPQQGQASLVVEVAGLETRSAQALLAGLDALRSAKNIYRGRVLELGANDMGGASIRFPELPATERADVVLPEGLLARVERHTLAVAARRDVLRA